jgi:hypothetical protein
MVIDSNHLFSRDYDLLEDVCSVKVELCNFLLAQMKGTHSEDDVAYYESEIRHYKCYNV